jgi:hypothetical protein
MMINNIFKRSAVLNTRLAYSFAAGANFLRMVESFFDRAAVHTGIRTDRLNFYKKAENVVKCSIPLIRGKTPFIQTMAPSKPCPPTAASIRLTSYPPRAEPDTPKTWISRR